MLFNCISSVIFSRGFTDLKIIVREKVMFIFTFK